MTISFLNYSPNVSLNDDRCREVLILERILMEIRRVWNMPNKWTFKIKPIQELLKKYVNQEKTWIDPFSGRYSPATITNDLNPEMETDYHMDAREFLKMFDDGYADGAIYDPPYSPTQVKRVYDGIGLETTANETRTEFWSEARDEITRVVKMDGIVISCGWNSNGIGKTRGFEILEILMVPHGGIHNDTIVVVEKKIKDINKDNIDIFKDEMI